MVSWCHTHTFYTPFAFVFVACTVLDCSGWFGGWFGCPDWVFVLVLGIFAGHSLPFPHPPHTLHFLPHTRTPTLPPSPSPLPEIIIMYVYVSIITINNV